MNISAALALLLANKTNSTISVVDRVPRDNIENAIVLFGGIFEGLEPRWHVVEHIFDNYARARNAGAWPWRWRARRRPSIGAVRRVGELSVHVVCAVCTLRSFGLGYY